MSSQKLELTMMQSSDASGAETSGSGVRKSRCSKCTVWHSSTQLQLQLASLSLWCSQQQDCSQLGASVKHSSSQTPKGRDTISAIMPARVTRKNFTSLRLMEAWDYSTLFYSSLASSSVSSAFGSSSTLASCASALGSSALASFLAAFLATGFSCSSITTRVSSM